MTVASVDAGALRFALPGHNCRCPCTLGREGESGDGLFGFPARVPRVYIRVMAEPFVSFAAPGTDPGRQHGSEFPHDPSGLAMAHAGNVAAHANALSQPAQCAHQLAPPAVGGLGHHGAAWGSPRASACGLCTPMTTRMHPAHESWRSVSAAREGSARSAATVLRDCKKTFARERMVCGPAR